MLNEAKINCEINTSKYNGIVITPAIISFIARETFRIGIHAVIGDRMIPGIVPIIRGMIIKKFIGPVIL